MMTFLICFDISDDAERRRVSRHLEQFGNRVQRSVFEVSVSARAEITALRRELLELLQEPGDLRIYPLCSDCRHGAVDADDRRITVFPSAILL